MSPWPADPAEIDPAQPAEWTVEVVEIRPHDPTAFTQGLEIFNDTLIESTGLYGESTVRLVDPLSGAVEATRALDPELFGEGLTRIDDTIVQLTWREGTLLRWQLSDLEPLTPLFYEGEGWGVCAMGDAVVTSDGTNLVRRRDPATWQIEGTAQVADRGLAVIHLNELECIGDHIVANVWLTDHLVVFDPDDGAVLARIDASSLATAIDRPADSGAVLNGVADLGDGTLLMTGKWWPSMAVVRVVPK